MASLAWRRLYPVPVAVLVVTANLVVNPQGEFTLLLSLVLVCFTIGYEARPPMHYAGLALVLVPFLLVSIQESLEPSDLAAGLRLLRGSVAGRQPAAQPGRARRRGRRPRGPARARGRARGRHRARRGAHPDRPRAARHRVPLDQRGDHPDPGRTPPARPRPRPRGRRPGGRGGHRPRGAGRDAHGSSGCSARRAATPPTWPPSPASPSSIGWCATSTRGDLQARLEIEGEAVPLSPGRRPGGVPHRPGGPHQRRAPLRRDGGGGDGALHPATARDRGRRQRPRGVGPRALRRRHGLVGIRERVALYNGTVSLEPGPTGGTRLAASLPLAEEAVGR